MRAMQQQFATALDSLTRQNVDLQAELAQNRQASSERACSTQAGSASSHCVGRRRRESMWIHGCWESRATSRVLKTRGETGVQRPSYAGAAVPRLQKLLVEAAKAGAPIPNATILEEDDRAASAQLHWMMLMICKGAALNIVLLAGDRVSRHGDN